MLLVYAKGENLPIIAGETDIRCCPDLSREPQRASLQSGSAQYSIPQTDVFRLQPFVDLDELHIGLHDR